MATPTHPAGFDPADPEPIVAPRLRPPLGLRLGNPTPAFRFPADLLAPIRLAVYLVWPLSVLACAVALFNWYDMLAIAPVGPVAAQGAGTT